MSFEPSPTSLCSKMVADALKADEALRRAGVAVVERDRGDFLSEIEAALAEADGPVALVCADGAENNRPGVSVDHSVLVAEKAGVNRAREGATTALEAAWLVVAALDGRVHHFIDLRHDWFPEDGVLQATVRFRTHFITTDTEPERN